MSIYNYPFIVSASAGMETTGSIEKVYATEASVITDVVWGDIFANPIAKVSHTNFTTEMGNVPIVAGSYLEGPIVRFKLVSGHVMIYKKRG